MSLPQVIEQGPFLFSPQIDRVFIWDLDETIILFHSLLTTTFATRHGEQCCCFFHLRRSRQVLELSELLFFFLWGGAVCLSTAWLYIYCVQHF